MGGGGGGGEALRKRILALNGVFAVNKPAGESSARVVERVKGALVDLIKGDRHLPRHEFASLQRSLKVGHGGTLDPLATGVLVIGLGRGCKRLHDFLKEHRKGYRAVGRFGQAYDTYDCTGQVTATRPFEHIEEAQIRQALRDHFTGNIMQTPPPFSALKINGERAYAIARKRQQAAAATRDDAKKRMTVLTEGEAGTEAAAAAAAAAEADKPAQERDADDKRTVDAGSDQDEMPKLAPRPILIERIELLRWESPEFEIDMECGSGTYVRSIIHDLGTLLHSAAAMFALVRTKQGPFALADCLQVADLSSLEKIEGALR